MTDEPKIRILMTPFMAKGEKAEGEILYDAFDNRLPGDLITYHEVEKVDFIRGELIMEKYENRAHRWNYHGRTWNSRLDFREVS